VTTFVIIFSTMTQSTGKTARDLAVVLRMLLFGVFCATLLLLAPQGLAVALQDQGSDEPLFLDQSTHEELKARSEELARQVAVDSTNYELTFELAGIYYDMGSLLMAAKYYGIAVELDPTSVRALVNHGVVLNEMGKSEEALDAYNTALEIDPKNTKALCNRGLAYYAVGKYEDAVDQYRLALDIDPKSLEAHYNLGVAFADAQIYREALVQWHKVVEIDPESDAARAAKANIEVIQQLIELEKKEEK
jgi:tetratricopeptide (TPR) repeat protein